jgi:hypothetical protein
MVEPVDQNFFSLSVNADILFIFGGVTFHRNEVELVGSSISRIIETLLEETIFYISELIGKILFR